MSQDTNRWYQPQTRRDAADAVENCKFIIRYLAETYVQESIRPGGMYTLSEPAITGLCQIYGIIEDVLDASNNILVKEVKA